MAEPVPAAPPADELDPGKPGCFQAWLDQLHRTEAAIGKAVLATAGVLLAEVEALRQAYEGMPVWFRKYVNDPLAAGRETAGLPPFDPPAAGPCSKGSPGPSPPAPA